jgi:hypothetical protein
LEVLEGVRDYVREHDHPIRDANLLRSYYGSMAAAIRKYDTLVRDRQRS